MPFVPADNPKCPKCGKSVYAAEEKVGGGHKWHKGCFKCEACNKFLDSTNCNVHDDKLYCKLCYAKLFGPSGFNVGAGAGVKDIQKVMGPE